MTFDEWWKQTKPAECDELKPYFEEAWEISATTERVEIENCHAKYRELFSAAQNLCKVKGRHHSEIAMRRLMEVCGVERPNVERNRDARHHRAAPVDGPVGPVAEE